MLISLFLWLCNSNKNLCFILWSSGYGHKFPMNWYLRYAAQLLFWPDIASQRKHIAPPEYAVNLSLSAPISAEKEVCWCSEEWSYLSPGLSLYIYIFGLPPPLQNRSVLSPSGGQNDDVRPLTCTLWGRGMGCRDKYVTSWDPTYGSLPAPLATKIPTLWIHSSGGRGRGGGSDIRSMPSIRPICKCRCPPLLSPLPPPPSPPE